MANYDELNNARFISKYEIPSDEEIDEIHLDEEVDTNACIISDVSTIDSDGLDEEDSFIIYTEEDIKEAERFGVTVQELFKIYEEINNYDQYEPYCNCEEWPKWPYGGGYEDEGLEESMY